jgi:hypothetical protein
MFEQLSGSAGNVLGFKMGEHVTAEDVRAIGGMIAEKIAVHTNIRLLIEFEGFPHMEPEALLEKLRFIRDHSGGIDRMAVVGNRGWIKAWVKIGGLFTRREVEYFERSDRQSAWEWLRG